MASQVNPIIVNGMGVDLSARVAKTSTVIGSPAAGSETIVATTPAFDPGVAIVAGCLVICELAYTIGTNGVSCRVRLRQGTGTSGAVVYDSGVQTGGHNTATQLVSDSAGGFDTAAAAGQQYTVTLLIGSGSATSTVSAVSLVAIAI